MSTTELKVFAGGDAGKIHLKTSMRKLYPREVLVKTTHSGLCYTDVHAKSSGCGLGHEGVGIVEEVGSAVKNVKLGERVGFGYNYSSCGHCDACLDGYVQYCPEVAPFQFAELDQGWSSHPPDPSSPLTNLQLGSLGNYGIRDEDFVYKIPEAMDSKHAGIFQCAGITVFEGLLAAGVKPTSRVGIVGVGGLGHLAIQYAKAMGASVVVFSTTDSKKEDAFKLGASEFITTKGVDSLKFENNGGLNALIFTSNEVPDLNPYMSTLAPRATIVPLTVQQKNIEVPFIPMLIPGHRLVFSNGASRKHFTEALEFAARHNIKPWIEEFTLTEEGVNQAFERLMSGKMRYRAVLVAQ
ncbi:MAG: hypothetical protein M1812_004346 [Candelaria pacifica]|nr:MAG: hypothetical protein M1812_004346 [Candelaria pacifica]